LTREGWPHPVAFRQARIAETISGHGPARRRRRGRGSQVPPWDQRDPRRGMAGAGCGRGSRGYASQAASSGGRAACAALLAGAVPRSSRRAWRTRPPRPVHFPETIQKNLAPV